MIILKSLCPQKPLHLWFWNHKNVGHVIPAGDVGAVRPVGAILPTATAAGPLRSRSRGRLRRSEGPCRPVMFGRWIISVTDHANMALAKTKKCRMILQQITMSLDRQNRAYKTCQHGTAELFTSSGQGLLIFDPLDNRNPSLLINYQKVSLLEESQEVGMKWGLGRSASFHTNM